MTTVALVTGGNRGIGREVGRQLAERGHTVVLTARSAGAAATAARAVHAEPATPQGRRRQLRITGPLPGERGRLAELLHITWIMRRTGPHVLAAQQQALPARTALAARPATQRLLTEAAAARTPLPALRTALADLL